MADVERFHHQVSAEMPKYRCHKVVHALQIRAVTYNKNDKTITIQPDNTRYADFAVDVAWANKHQPTAGGYYVVYEDGYASFSPAKAFEEGYTLIE